MTGCWTICTPFCAVADGWVVRVSRYAGPAVRVMVPEVAAVRPAAEKLSVRAPTFPWIVRVLKVARPLAFVVAVVVPPSTPPPVAMAAVRTTPDCATGVLDPSWSWIDGCCASVAPLATVVDGCVVIDNCVGAAAPTAMLDDVARVRPLA